MKVVDEVEHEDGSATYTFDMTDAERRICTEQGILWMIVAGATGVTPESVMRDWIEKSDVESRVDAAWQTGYDAGRGVD